MKRALVIQHVGFEGLAGLAAPVADAGYAVEHVLAPAPGFETVDLLAPDLPIVGRRAAIRPPTRAISLAIHGCASVS